MANLLLWVGLTMIVALPAVWSGESANFFFIGGVVMIVGAVVLVMDFINARRK